MSGQGGQTEFNPIFAPLLSLSSEVPLLALLSCVRLVVPIVSSPQAGSEEHKYHFGGPKGGYLAVLVDRDPPKLTQNIGLDFFN